MSKCSNKQQIQHLLKLMEQNPEIGRGFFKGGKDELQRFWKNAEDELNSLGPPTKNITDWKKVWSDQKKYVRQKAAQNLQHQKGTGGGPNREYIFSSTEQAIFNLIGMKTSVEGVAANRFGLVSSEHQLELPEATPDMSFDVVTLDLIQDSPECTPTSPCSKSSKLNKKAKETLPKDSVKNSSNILEAELAIQRELVSTVKEAVADLKEQQQYTKKMYRSLDKIYDLQRKHFQVMEKVKQEEVQEMRRHHSFMEEMRVREVEYKLEKNRLHLQIEDLNKSL